jgi:DNA-binding transcriptional LysR family regulator
MFDYNLKQLEAFAAVVECGSFTAAAQKLYLAQSTVSGHVSALEKAFGVPMLLRSNKRKIILSEEGKRVYTHVKAILQSCDLLTQDIENRNSLEVSLAASTIPMDYLLPEFIAGFTKIMPTCQFVVHGGDSNQAHALVVDGDAQIGFVGAVLNRKELYYDLLLEDKLVLLAPDNDKYRAMFEAGVPGNALVCEPLIFRKIGSGTQQAVDQFLCENRINTDDIHVIARIDSADAVLHAVSKNLGVAIVSELAAKTVQNVLAFPLEGKSTTRCLYMIHPKNRRLPDTAQKFLNYVQNNKQDTF